MFLYYIPIPGLLGSRSGMLHIDTLVISSPTLQRFPRVEYVGTCRPAVRQ